MALAAKPCDPPAREEREQRETDRAIECSPEAGVKGAAAPLRGAGCPRPDSSFRAGGGENLIALERESLDSYEISLMVQFRDRPLPRAVRAVPRSKTPAHSCPFRPIFAHSGATSMSNWMSKIACPGARQLSGWPAWQAPKTI